MSDKYSDQDTPAIPRRIGKYEIRGLLGQGAVGIVYRGYDADIDRPVAIKVLHPHLRNSDFVLRFKHEARAAARCVHLNIVTVFDFGLHDNSPYMVMEYVEGVDLRSFLLTNRPLSTRLSCDIILCVLQALDFAHQSGVVHRDIKPGNILLLDNGTVKVADFGVARIENSDLTQAGAVIGTPLYMAPEAWSGTIVDNRADLFNVGVVLLELICGLRPKQPIRSLDDAALLLQQSPLGADELNNFRRISKRALAPLPADRFQTAQEFSNELKAIISPAENYQHDPETLSTAVKMTQHAEEQAASTGQAAAAHSELPPSQFEITVEMSKQLGDILSTYVGPLAAHLIKSASKKSRNFNELVDNLASKIPSENERQQFMKKLEGASLASFADKSSGAPGGSLGPGTTDLTGEGAVQSRAFSVEQLERVTQDLILYLGPIASSLVKRSAKHADDLHQLYLLVSEHINNAEERKQFLEGKFQ